MNLNTYYPFVTEVVIPLGLSMGALAILPTALRRIHESVEQGSATVLHPGKSRESGTPYELSLWCALEDPCRLLTSFLFLSQIGAVVAPTTIATRYVTRIWSGGSVACFVWFLQRWKRNVLQRFLKARKMSSEEKDHYLALDQATSLILLFIGGLGLAEASGVAVQSLLTVGGIGGVATAFAARDVLGNILSGLRLVISKPFIQGDLIKAGSVEGRVEEVGLHSTRLLNSEKNPIMVPNSFFSNEIIVNKSRAPWRALSVRVPVRLQDFEKIEKITADIRSFLSNHAKAFLGEDKPRCSISHFAPTAVEIIITCNIKSMSNDEFYLTEQEILIEAARIITRSGAVLGGAW